MIGFRTYYIVHVRCFLDNSFSFVLFITVCQNCMTVYEMFMKISTLLLTVLKAGAII